MEFNAPDTSTLPSIFLEDPYSEMSTRIGWTGQEDGEGMDDSDPDVRVMRDGAADQWAHGTSETASSEVCVRLFDARSAITNADNALL
jgi:hypothetical protein